MAGIEDKVDKAYETKSIQEIAAAPVAALQGISDAKGELLKQALGVTTIAELGNNKYIQWAVAIAKLAE